MAKTGIKLKNGYSRKEYQKAYNMLMWATRKEESNTHVKAWRKKNAGKLSVINKRYYKKRQKAILIYQQLLSLEKK